MQASPSPFLLAAAARAQPVADVASVLLPALVAEPLSALAAQVAEKQGCPARGARYERNLVALTGRLFVRGGWMAGSRRAGAEPLATGRSRPYDESTVRKAARELSKAGAATLAEQQLQQQVHHAVGDDAVTAYTDLYDQEYWTKKPAHAGPVGSLGNRLLAATYFGLTFVQKDAGPRLAFSLSWHKPASPLIDALKALHDSPERHRWLTAHVKTHVLDRGTQGNPTLRWALGQAIPYLTLSKGKVEWKRYRNPTHHTASKVPVFVRPDGALKEETLPASPWLSVPLSVVFPARPEQGKENGRAIRYRMAAKLSDEQFRTLDEVYKARWPNNENPIKALKAVGFGVNRDRTLDLTTSRGHDGEVARTREAVERIEAKIATLNERPWRKAIGPYLVQRKKKKAKQRELQTLQWTPVTMGARTDRGGERLCKLLMLWLYNALALLLWRSPLKAVQAMTPATVCNLLLARPAIGCIGKDTLTLWVEAMVQPIDQLHQQELVRLMNAAGLKSCGLRLALRIRDPAAQNKSLRVSA